MHPHLAPLLEKYGISWDDFSRKGRPPKGVSELRSCIVTDLHAEGRTWADVMAITGLSNGAVQRLTKAKRNPNTMARVRSSAAELGRSGAGVPKPWLSDDLRRRWADGRFDFHCAPRSEKDRVALRASWTDERRVRMSNIRTRLWAEASYRGRLEAYHRSPEVRRQRSTQQAYRMAHAPATFIRGVRSFVFAMKCDQFLIHTRSSYETAVVHLLESDPRVRSYTYEPTMTDECGVLFPDFVVTWADGGTTLIEVKAHWVTRLPPEHKVTVRLERSRRLADRMGWSFDIWTENRKEVRDALARTP